MNKKSFLAVVVVIIFAMLWLRPAFADDMSDVKTGIIQLQKDVSELKGILLGIAAGIQGGPSKATAGVPNLPGTPGVQLSEAATGVDDNPILGDLNAPVTIVEFSDYQCPYCGKFYRETLPNIKKEFIASGKVRFVYRDFPLDGHQHARSASMAVNCAGEQNKYWEMHDAVFVNQQDLSDMEGIAKKAGVDIKKLKTCVNSKKFETEIEKDLNEGKAIGVGGTPSFIIGKTSQDGSVKGKLIPGALPFSAFKAEIEALLRQ